MKKKLDTSAILNELKEASHFFRKPQPSVSPPLPETKSNEPPAKAQEPDPRIVPSGQHEGTVFEATTAHKEAVGKSVEAQGLPAADAPPNPEAAKPDEAQNVSEETKKQISLETNQQGNKETSEHVSNETKKLGNKALKRYATYLRSDSIKAMKRLAFEMDRKDYELFQEAVDEYLRSKERSTGE